MRLLVIKDVRIVTPPLIMESAEVFVENGRITTVTPSNQQPIPENAQIINGNGQILAPGFIDMHCHHFFGTDPDAYLSNGNQALPPDGFTFRNGVTSVLDTGGSGWKNFELFKKQTIDQAGTRVLAL